MNFAKLPPAPGGALAERRTADRLLACNDVTMSYGLALTEQQALALAQTRTDALRETRRIEWGDGIVTWGAGTDTDIIVAGIHALVSAINNK